MVGLDLLEENVQDIEQKAAPLTEKAACQEKLGEVDAAKALYRIADRLKETYVPFLIRYGWFMVKLGEIAEGIKILEKGYRLQKKNLKLRKKLARALLLSDEDRVEEAQDHFEYIYLRDENDYISLLGLGQVHERRGEYETALDFLQKAVAHEKADINCKFFLGTVYAKMKDFKKALGLFREVLRKRRNYFILI